MGGKPKRFADELAKARAAAASSGYAAKAPPATVEVGTVSMALANDIANLHRIAVAYKRTAAAIDELKRREPYLELEKDLVALLESR